MRLSEFTREKAFTPLFGGRLSHAYIVSGAEPALAEACAATLAAAMVCSGDGDRPCMVCKNCIKARRAIHPDIITAGPEPGAAAVPVDRIRELREDAVVMPNEAARKVYIIRAADTMNRSAQNALLKVLEEPPPSASFILVAGNPAALLPTVRSRCVAVGLDAGEAEASEAAARAAEFFDAAQAGALRLAAFTFSLDRLGRDELGAFLTAARELAVKKLRGEMCAGGALPRGEYLMLAARVLKRAEEMLEYNVGAGHIMGYICAGLMK